MQTFTKKVLLAFSLLVFHFMLIKGQAPYTAQFTTVNGTQFSPTDAHICPSNGGYATLKAYAEWPFGVGYQSVKYLYISEGSTYHIPCGAVVDYDSIRIDSGGTLIIDDYNGTGIGTTTGTPWTIIGCKGSFVLNGMIQCTNGAHHGGTFQLTEPDSTGILNIPSLSITITQQSGGNGGYGQVSGEQNGSTGGNFVVVNPGGNGGTQFNGNGGGGGGGGGCSAGSSGGNASDDSSGYGGSEDGSTQGVGLYGNNGQLGVLGTVCSGPSNSSNGGSGGTRGKHGGLLFIKAMQSITGKGDINVSGQNGGNGGATVGAQTNSNCSTGFAGTGGGGGGGAGGSGGYVYIKYVGSSPTISINDTAGLGGSGGHAANNPSTASGAADGASCYNSSGNGDYCQNGFAGDSGMVGQHQLLPIQGFTYQWRKNSTNISGATLDTITAYSAGKYDCKITNLTYSKIYYTSGTLGINKDTVFSDSSVIAQINSVSATTICAGDSSEISAQYVEGQTYQWYFNGNPANGTGASTPTYYATQTGSYIVYASNSCLNPTASNPAINITVAPLPGKPTITANGATTFCQGDSIKLTSSDAMNNTWSTGATTQSIIVKTNGNYSVSFMGSNGCSATSAIDTVTVKPASVNAGADTALTCGSSINLNAVCNPPTPTSIVWSPSTYLSSSTIVNPICTPTTTVTYTITANLSDGCTAKDTIKITNNPASDVQICVVSVDTGSTNNVIIWNKAGLTHIDSFKVYYQTSPTTWALIKEVAFADSNYLVDNTPGNSPTSKTVRYCLTAVDSCGNEEPISESAWQNTMHINMAPTGTFTWSSTGYLKEGIANPVITYVLYRDSLGNGKWDSINYVPGNQNTMSDAAYLANPGAYPLSTRWYVGAILSDSVNTGCTLPVLRPEAVNNTTTRSNTQHNTIFTGATTLTSATSSISVFPNPANQILNIKFNGAKAETARLSIEDVTGREICSELSIVNGELSINIGNLSSGIYFVKVTTNTSTQVVKFVKE